MRSGGGRREGNEWKAKPHSISAKVSACHGWPPFTVIFRKVIPRRLIVSPATISADRSLQRGGLSREDTVE